MTRNFIRPTALIILILLSGLGGNIAKANVVSQPTNGTLKTGRVIGENKNVQGVNLFVVQDEASGMIYFADPTNLDLHVGNIVTYTSSNSSTSFTPAAPSSKGAKGNIIVRDIIRK